MSEKPSFLIRLWRYFTTYEKCWLISIVVLSFVIAFLFPEEETLGINGNIIMMLYLINIFTNVTCELLISKQSKWNFIVSLFVEASELSIYITLAYRFATMATTIFFWIPIDIISFISWHRHGDQEEKELTEVRKLSGKQEVIVITAIFVWTIVVGYFLTRLEINGLLSENPTMETLVCYLDACVSAVGVANGLFILFRYREQWIAWYISTILETVINIISGQWVLLVLKAGYLTNTTYGYIKWTKYIRKHNNKKLSADSASVQPSQIPEQNRQNNANSADIS